MLIVVMVTVFQALSHQDTGGGGVKRENQGPDVLISNLSSAIYELCNLMEVTLPLWGIFQL